MYINWCALLLLPYSSIPSAVHCEQRYTICVYNYAIVMQRHGCHSRTEMTEGISQSVKRTERRQRNNSTVAICASIEWYRCGVPIALCVCVCVVLVTESVGRSFAHKCRHICRLCQWFGFQIPSNCKFGFNFPVNDETEMHASAKVCKLISPIWSLLHGRTVCTLSLVLPSIWFVCVRLLPLAPSQFARYTATLSHSLSIVPSAIDWSGKTHSSAFDVSSAAIGFGPTAKHECAVWMYQLRILINWGIDYRHAIISGWMVAARTGTAAKSVRMQVNQVMCEYLVIFCVWPRELPVGKCKCENKAAKNDLLLLIYLPDLCGSA